MAKYKRRMGGLALLGIIAIFLVLGLVSIALLGSFPGLAGDARKTQSDSYWRGGESGGTYNAPSQGGSYGEGTQSYWVYDPFRDGRNTMLFWLGCIFMPLLTLMRVSDRSQKNDMKTIAIALLASVLMFGGMLVLVDGFMNMLSLYPSTSRSVPSTGMQYGWILMSALLLFFSWVCLYVGEMWRKENKGTRTLYSIMMHNVGLFLVLYSAVALVSFTGSFIDIINRWRIGSTYGIEEVIYSPPRLFGWLVFSVILAGIAYKLLEYSKKSAEDDELAEYTYNTPASFAGIILFASGLFMLVTFMAKFVNVINPTGGAEKFPFLEAIFGAVYMIVALYFFHWLIRKQEEQEVMRTGHYAIVAAGTALVAIGLFGAIFTFNSLMQTTYEYSQKGNTNALMNEIFWVALGIVLLYVAYKWTHNGYDPQRMQEGGGMNGFFEDAEAKKRAEEEAEEPVSLESIAKRLTKIEGKLDRIEGLLKKK